MKNLSVASLILVFSGTIAAAECPSSPPFSPNLGSGDQAVNAAWLDRTLSGRKLVFETGTEVYYADGRYSYITGNEQFDAASYRFYDNGVRCIGYSRPRFDSYVVNNGALVLVDTQGVRYVGQLTN